MFKKIYILKLLPHATPLLVSKFYNKNPLLYLHAILIKLYTIVFYKLADQHNVTVD